MTLGSQLLQVAQFSTVTRVSAVSCALVSLLAFGCTTDDRESNTSDPTGIGSLGSTDDNGDGDGDDPTTTTGGGPKLDQGDGNESGTVPCGEGDFCDCEVPDHVPCDSAADTPIARALGLSCPNEPAVNLTTDGNPAAIGKRNNFGNQNAFPPQEGSQFVVLGSGLVADLDNAAGLGACSSDLGAYDPITLKAPLVSQNVGGQTCADNPALVGNGDCSNTIADQLQGYSVNDYTELRFTTQVPNTVNSISYSLAFFSYEYPDYYLSQFNDMYIGWLDSEVWTGNISFDEMGNPISLNAGFLDYRDDAGQAPELHGTCMQGHAGTKWLTTTAGVQPGETITVVFAIFDVSDSILDSYVFLDNFSWGCDGESPPSTVPIE